MRACQWRWSTVALLFVCYAIQRRLQHSSETLEFLRQTIATFEGEEAAGGPRLDEASRARSCATFLISLFV